MGMVWEVLVTLVCAVALAMVSWWLFGLLLRPLPGREAKLDLSGRGEGEDLEQQVRSLIRLRGMGLLRCPVVIVDVDLTPAGRELALRLAARWPGVILWPVSDLQDYMMRG